MIKHLKSAGSPPLWFIAAACLAVPAAAHPRESLLGQPAAHVGHRQIVKVATASVDDSPRARIRGDRTGKGLTPDGFSRWLSRHPAIAQPRRAESSLRILASTASRHRAVIADSFDIADINRDNRVSADELADFITRASDPARSVFSPV